MTRLASILAGVASIFLVGAGLLPQLQADPVPGIRDFPEAFDVGDFKFLPADLTEIQNHLRQEASVRGETFDDGLDVREALNLSLAKGPDVLISLVDSPNPALVEFAVAGLALKFGPNAGPAVPALLRLIGSGRQDDAVVELAILGLGRIAPADPAVAQALTSTLAAVAPDKQGLRHALTVVLGTMGPVAAAAKEPLERQLAGGTVVLQYKSALALAQIDPAEPVAPKALIERGSLEGVDPVAQVAVLNGLASATPDETREVLSLFAKAAGPSESKFPRCLLFDGMVRTGQFGAEELPILIEALADDDPFLSHFSAECLSRVDGKSEVAVPELASALASSNPKVRLAVATALKRLGPAAAPASGALAAALKRCTPESSEAELGALLEALKAIGPDAHPAAEVVASLLPEQSPLFQDRPKYAVHHLRAFMLATLAEIGVPRSALPFIVDSVANSDTNSAYVFAAGAKAAGAMGPEARGSIRFLLRPLKHEIRDEFISFESLRSHRSSDGRYTNCLIEAIRALGRMGATAREAVPFLEEIVKEPDLGLHGTSRLYQLPDVNEEARKALRAING